MDQKPGYLKLFLRLSKPYLLLASLLAALLGTGMATYLNHAIDWAAFTLGLLFVIAVQLAALYLNEYFDLYIDSDPESHTRFFGGSQVLGSGEGKLPRRTGIVAGTAALMLAAGFVIMLQWYAGLGFTNSVLVLLFFFSGLAYSIPPFRLARSGYGELIFALFYGIMVPALSFTLQAGQVHRLIMMVGLPIVLLLVSMNLALSFPEYSIGGRHNRVNMLQKIGWENGMLVHNTLILLAYLSLAGAVLLGFPRMIGMRAIYTIPLGALQFWLMGRVAAGAKPAWSAIRFNAVSLVLLVVLLLTISFWS